MKKNFLSDTTAIAMEMVKANINRRIDDTSLVFVDCTAGNGNDTLELLRFCPHAILYALDIQPTALRNTEWLLKENGVSMHNVTFVNDTFTNIEKHIEHADVCMFNLGYLPGGDKSVVSKGEDTVKAVIAAENILNCDGIISILMYPGHSEGAKERDMLLNHVKTLNKSAWHTAYMSFPNQTKNPPELLFISRKK